MSAEADGRSTLFEARRRRITHRIVEVDVRALDHEVLQRRRTRSSTLKNGLPRAVQH